MELVLFEQLLFNWLTSSPRFSLRMWLPNKSYKGAFPLWSVGYQFIVYVWCNLPSKSLPSWSKHNIQNYRINYLSTLFLLSENLFNFNFVSAKLYFQVKNNKISFFSNCFKFYFSYFYNKINKILYYIYQQN